MVAHGQSAHLYSPAAQLAFQHDILHTASGLIPYIRPPFYALLIAPLALLSLHTAFIVWIAVQTGILAGCWIWGYRTFGRPALLVASIFMPAFLGIANGQDCVLVLALLIGSLALAQQEKPWLAGALLGAMLMKFHLVLLWPLALILQRRWKMLSGFALAAAAEGILSVTAAGTGGIRDYMAILRNHSLENLSPSPEFMISVPGLLANLGIDSVAASVIGAALVITVWAIASRHAELTRLYALTSVAGLLLVAHAYGYDAAMLLLAIWLTFFLSAQRPAKITALLLATPFPFCMTLAGKPWAALSSVSLLAFLAVLASYRYQASAERIENPESLAPEPACSAGQRWPAAASAN